MALARLHLDAINRTSEWFSAGEQFRQILLSNVYKPAPAQRQQALLQGKHEDGDRVSDTFLLLWVWGQNPCSNYSRVPFIIWRQGRPRLSDAIFSIKTRAEKLGPSSPKHLIQVNTLPEKHLSLFRKTIDKLLKPVSDVLARRPIGHLSVKIE
jgi:hypothetical protein